MNYSINTQNFLLIFLIISALFQSCNKDTGNYTYSDINEAVVTGLDSLYVVEKEGVINIKPIVSYSKDPVGDTTNYRYAWLILGKDGYNSGRPNIMDSTFIFNSKVKLDVGFYSCAFRVTDKNTGVWKQFPFRLFVSSKTYEGWYLLSEVANQQSRLDMVSYDPVNKKYIFYEDVLKAAESTLKLEGKPSFISYLRTLSKPVIGTSADPIAIATNKMAVLVEPNELKYRPNFNFSVFVQDATNPAISEKSRMECKNFISFLSANNKVYTTEGYSKLIQVNFKEDLEPFKASRFVSHNPATSASILFDETESEFVWYPGSGQQYCQTLNNGKLYNNKIGKNLMYMKYVTYNGGQNFAILKDKTGNKVYMARFTTSSQLYFQEITGTQIAQAENFEVSDVYGYVFYNVGGKLYEYDFNTKANILMADYGNKKISLLKFQYIPYTNDPKKERYLEITRRLVVCAYDTGNLNTSGTMDIYSVPARNEKLIKEESYSGMGKIVSIDYRDR
ncbi:PKD-like family lipoprotein [Sphingobacterium spiritivorum]|uniref:PKD-like family lipoprotein n=1 Tax=Sphingobacterium spiritivorum TaxID=258 RepID=UPI003DA61C48